MKTQMFKSIEDMEKFYYGDLNFDSIQKTDAGIESGQTG